MICLTSLAGSAVGRRRSLHAALLAAALLTTIPGLPAARAAETTVADAAGAGFDAARLTALGDRLAADAEAGRIPGAVLAVERDGQLVTLRAVGWQDRAAGTKMTEDSLFRLYSMTKPIVSVAAMRLIEDGRLLLAAPVSAYLPDFARLEVGREVAGADGKPTVETTPATHKMTVRDLLRHTSGLTYGVFGKSAIKSRYLAAGTHLWTDTNEQYAARLAKLPLVAEPGTLWEYGRSTDLLGRVLEVAAGKPLDEVVAGLVLKPLGMTETFFHVPEALRSRVAAADPEAAFGNKPPELLDPARPDTFLSGGGGMYGSTRDYLRFLRMILNGGELEGTRILSPASVRLMTADHLTPEIDTGGLAPLGYGFGLGFAVRRGEDGAWPGSTGDLYWGGYAGTYFWIDPREKLLVVYMMQSVSQREPYRLIVRQGVYGAMTR
ncbi:MAG: serine hydrolase [Tistrella sp.]|nr:serine hydrolase domain-containing protein [Tistrella sp.]MAD38041.1 serine hydrolase [Tistrella sp.]MBA78373.1 serine hydrolase [Tistrella sp.]